MGKKNENLAMIASEYEKACEKHPKFCDEFTQFDIATALSGELSFKAVNSIGPYQADMLLQEEIWEATVAYLNGDLKHAIAELAQCGAVILRMMQFVQDEMEAKG